MTEKKLNIFVWIGFALDLIGFFIAMLASFWLGIGIIVLGLVFSIVGLLLCIQRNGAVGTAIFYVVMDVGFLIYLFAIHN